MKNMSSQLFHVITNSQKIIKTCQFKYVISKNMSSQLFL